MNLLLEGDDLAALLLRAHREGGTAARIVRAEKIRRGGILGFFAREGFEVAVEIPKEDESGDGSEEDPESAAAQASASAPASAAAPGIGLPGASPSGTVPSGAGPSGAGQPGAGQPGAGQSGTVPSGAGQPDPGQPGQVPPLAGLPVAGQPVAVRTAGGLGAVAGLTAADGLPGLAAADGLLGLADRASAAERIAAQAIARRPVSPGQSPSTEVASRAPDADSPLAPGNGQALKPAYSPALIPDESHSLTIGYRSDPASAQSPALAPARSFGNAPIRVSDSGMDAPRPFTAIEFRHVQVPERTALATATRTDPVDDDPEVTAAIIAAAQQISAWHDEDRHLNRNLEKPLDQRQHPPERQNWGEYEESHPGWDEEWDDEASDAAIWFDTRPDPAAGISEPQQVVPRRPFVGLVEQLRGQASQVSEGATGPTRVPTHESVFRLKPGTIPEPAADQHPSSPAPSLEQSMSDGSRGTESDDALTDEPTAESPGATTAMLATPVASRTRVRHNGPTAVPLQRISPEKAPSPDPISDQIRPAEDTPAGPATGSAAEAPTESAVPAADTAPVLNYWRQGPRRRAAAVDVPSSSTAEQPDTAGSTPATAERGQAELDRDPTTVMKLTNRGSEIRVNLLSPPGQAPAAEQQAEQQAERLIAERADTNAAAEQAQAEAAAEQAQAEAAAAEHARRAAETAQIRVEAEAVERARVEAEAAEAARIKIAAERAQIEAEATEHARIKAEAAEAARIKIAAERAQIEAEATERARAEAEAADRARAEANEQARAEAEAADRARAEANEQARAEAEAADRARAEANEQARAEAEAADRARAEANEQARAEAEAADRARAEAEVAQIKAAAEAAAAEVARIRATAEAAAAETARVEAQAAEVSAAVPATRRAIRISSRDQLATERASLQALGIPAAWTQHLVAGDRLASILTMLKQMPEPRLRDDLAVIAVVGPEGVVGEEAQRIASEQRTGGRTRAVTVTAGSAGIDRRTAIARSRRTRPVVISVPVDDQHHFAAIRATLASLQAEAVVAVLDAGLPLAEAAAWLAEIGPVDAITLTGAPTYPEPFALLGLALPVVGLDGRSLNREGWAAMLCAQLSTGDRPR